MMADQEENDFVEVELPKPSGKKARCFYCETIIFDADSDNAAQSYPDQIVCSRCRVAMDPRQRKISDFFKR